MGSALAVAVAFPRASGAFQGTNGFCSDAPSHAPNAPITHERVQFEIQQELMWIREAQQKSMQEIEQSTCTKERANDLNESLHKQKLEAKQKLEQQEKAMSAEFEPLKRDIEKRVKRQLQELQKQNLRDYPKPSHIDTSKLNVGLVGSSGVGKSSLINALLQRNASDNGAAKIGCKECIHKPTSYAFDEPTLSDVLLWDLPSTGTSASQALSYLKEIGLRYYDAVLIVSAGSFTEMDFKLKDLLKEYQVPCHIIRTKIDIDIESNIADYRKDASRTLRDLHFLYKVLGIDILLVSARPGKHGIGDWTKLQETIAKCRLRNHSPGVHSRARKRKADEL